MKMSQPFLILSIGLLLLSAPLRAEPKMIRLDQLLQRLTTVAVGQCLGHERLASGQLGLGYRLRVDRVLLGDPAFVGVRRATTTGQVHVTSGTPCVAFFNKQKSLEWIAVPVRGTSLHSAPLRLSGVYSFNAYLVVPQGRRRQPPDRGAAQRPSQAEICALARSAERRDL